MSISIIIVNIVTHSSFSWTYHVVSHGHNTACLMDITQFLPMGMSRRVSWTCHGVSRGHTTVCLVDIRRCVSWTYHGVSHGQTTECLMDIPRHVSWTYHGMSRGHTTVCLVDIPRYVSWTDHGVAHGHTSACLLDIPRCVPLQWDMMSIITVFHFVVYIHSVHSLCFLVVMCIRWDLVDNICTRSPFSVHLHFPLLLHFACMPALLYDKRQCFPTGAPWSPCAP